MRKSRKGKLVYLSIPAIDGLTELGRRYLTRDFDKSDRVSYHRACLLLLKWAFMGEKMYREEMKLTKVEEKKEL